MIIAQTKATKLAKVNATDARTITRNQRDRKWLSKQGFKQDKPKGTRHIKRRER